MTIEITLLKIHKWYPVLRPLEIVELMESDELKHHLETDMPAILEAAWHDYCSHQEERDASNRADQEAHERFHGGE
jgi:hypothetical protein